ncbi:MAG: ABC transporter ATP-binding protein, partial [Clostridiales bacterium]|nr:ABC transporter ATP-binding protein [Clostridiales bacterium]
MMILKGGMFMEIIRCEHLSKIYQTGENKVYALDDVTLSLEQGSFTAITGPSGSGKSTLLHLLSGLDRPTGGDVIYQGKKLYDYRDNQLSVLRRRRFGFVFQSYNLVKELTGWENILLPVMLDNRRADEKYL